MSNPAAFYMIRDASGNLYGPADAPTLRQWVREGRILPAMLIAYQGSEDFKPAGAYPELADLFGGASAGSPAGVPFPPAADPYATDYRSVNVVPNTGATGRNNSLAVAAFVLSLVSVVPGCCCGVLGIPAAIAGVVLGVIAMGQIKASAGHEGGRGLAMAAVIIGVVALAFQALSLLLSLSGVLHHPLVFPAGGPGRPPGF